MKCLSLRFSTKSSISSRHVARIRVPRLALDICWRRGICGWLISRFTTALGWNNRGVNSAQSVLHDLNDRRVRLFSQRVGLTVNNHNALCWAFKERIHEMKLSTQVYCLKRNLRISGCIHSLWLLLFSFIWFICLAEQFQLTNNVHSTAIKMNTFM